MECDWVAHTTALETADVAKWVIRTGGLFDATARNDQHEYVGRSLHTAGDRPRRQPGALDRPAAEAAAEGLPHRKAVVVKGARGLFSNCKSIRQHEPSQQAAGMLTSPCLGGV